MEVSLSFDCVKRQWRASWRTRRMQEFLARVVAAPGAAVLDVGGVVDIWELVNHRLDVTLFNTDEASARGFRDANAIHGCYRVATGDACDLGRFDDASFDVVFSNSVIEHLGDDRRVSRFAREVRRVGRSYWVQTPSWLFPIESHTSLPFFWLYPKPLRTAIARRLDVRYARNPWSCPMMETRRFRLGELQALFPDAAVYTERVCGITKSWSLYRSLPCA